jgi:hypothetical protein
MSFVSFVNFVVIALLGDWVLKLTKGGPVGSQDRPFSWLRPILAYDCQSAPFLN